MSKRVLNEKEESLATSIPFWRLLLYSVLFALFFGGLTFIAGGDLVQLVRGAVFGWLAYWFLFLMARNIHLF